MKLTHLICLSILLSTSAMASNISIKKMKCSILGNLKIKIKGLDTKLPLRKKYLKADIPFFDSCNDALVELSQRVGRSSQQAEVSQQIYLVQTERYEARHYDTRYYDHSRPYVRGNKVEEINFDYLSNVYCETTRVTKLKVIFNNMPELEFKVQSNRLVSSRFGYCY